MSRKTQCTDLPQFVKWTFCTALILLVGVLFWAPCLASVLAACFLGVALIGALTENKMPRPLLTHLANAVIAIVRSFRPK